MTAINSKEGFKDLSLFGNNTTMNCVNNSVLVDDEKTLNLIRQVIAGRKISNRINGNKISRFIIYFKYWKNKSNRIFRTLL